MVELGALQRKEALNDRLNARLFARAELQAGADQLKEAAANTERGARNAFIIAAVTAVASAAFAAGALKITVSSAKADLSAGKTLEPGITLKPPTGGGADAPDMSGASQIAAAKAQAINLVGGTANSIGQSSSGMANAMDQSAAQIHQATQAEFQAEAEVTRSEGELEASEQQALHEFTTQMIQFIKELREIEAEELGIFAKG